MIRDEPRQLPPLSLMLGDLGDPAPRVLARGLGVSVRTVQRWIAADQAPRAVMLAVFWSTRWGRSTIEAHAYNEAAQAFGLAECYRRERDALRRELARVLAAADFGSANEPTMRELPARLVPLAPDPLAKARKRADDERAHDGAADDEKALANERGRWR
jgi:predicted DNA-binding transcriptional regulator AlpA